MLRKHVIRGIVLAVLLSGISFPSPAQEKRYKIAIHIPYISSQTTVIPSVPSPEKKYSGKTPDSAPVEKTVVKTIVLDP
jgi:hypothetical protein